MTVIPTKTILGQVSAFFLARQEVSVGTSQKECDKVPTRFPFSTTLTYSSNDKKYIATKGKLVCNKFKDV